MAWHPMKPETAERKIREMKEEGLARKRDLRRRLAEKAKTDPFFAELLEEHDRRNENDNLAP
jgi:hypothetical protein